MKLVHHFIFIFCFFSPLLSFAQEDHLYSAFNLKELSPEFSQLLIQTVPEIKNKNFNEFQLNQIIKKVSANFSFENLKIIETNNELFLVGSQSTQVSEILFEVSSEIHSADLKVVASLSLDDANNANKVSQSIEKIRLYLKNLGYRNSKIKVDYRINNNLSRQLAFTIILGAKTIISSITLTGLDIEDQKLIEKQIYWLGVGHLLSDDTIKSITLKIRTYLSQLGYYLVAVQSPQIFFNAKDTEARVVYKLQQQKKYKVELIGAKNYSNLFLTTEVLNLETYFSTESNFGAELSEKLRTYYVENGYSLFDVTYYERKVNNVIVLTLNIDEGSKNFIQKINFTGQISRPESYYLNQFLEFSSQKIKDHLWVRLDAEQSGKNLITSLQNEGFVSAKLVRIEANKSTINSKNVHLNIVIEEGPQSQIESINFHNNMAFKNDELLEKLGLRANQTLNLNDLEKAVANLKVFYAENGYMEMRVTNEKSTLTSERMLTYNPDYSKAQINMTISEGVPLSVGTIILDGNKLTHDKLILTELEFKQNDLLTPQKIEESVSRLQKTGHFTSVDIYTLEPFSSVKERTVVVKVSERKPILLTVGLGATNENERTFHAYLGAAHRNFGGWGRGLSGRGELNYNDVFLKFLEKKITLGYLEPYLLDTRTRFRINYTTAVNVSDVNTRKQTIANSATWSVEQDFTSHITGIWDIYNITNYVEKGLTVEDEVKYSYTGQDFVIASTGPILDFDFRDQILNPQSGHFSRLSLEYSTHRIGSHKVDDFIRATGQTTLYLPFSKNRIIWANSVRGGYAAPIDATAVGVPYDKKGFILGGRSTIRGFESNEFFPTSSLTNPETLGTNYRFTTPTSYQLLKSEIRFPLMPKYDVSAALFYDGGRVIIEGVHFADSYRDSLGFGIRYATPVGPLNLEYAHKLDRKPSESEGAFHLSVGVF